MKLSKLAICGAVVAALSACGGGGGGGNEPTVSNFPVEASFISFFSKDATHNVSAKDNQGRTIDLAYRIMPMADGTHPDLGATTLKRFAQIYTFTFNGSNVSSGSSEVYYSNAPFTLWGTYEDAVLDEATTKEAAPARANVGDSGLLLTGSNSYYFNSTLQTSTRTIGWSLERATPSTAWLCINIAASNEDGPYSESTCARINESGEVLGFKTTGTGAGISITFQ